MPSTPLYAQHEDREPEFRGPFPLTHLSLEMHVPMGVPGVFLLGDCARDTFYVEEVGRDDLDLWRALVPGIGRHSSFKFAVQPGGRSAFETECRLHHAFRPPARPVHPQPPPGTGWRCPVCR